MEDIENILGIIYATMATAWDIYLLRLVIILFIIAAAWGVFKQMHRSIKL